MSTINPIHRAHAGLDATAVDRLDHGRYAVLGTVNDDGSVHVAPLMYWYENGRIYLETAASSRKVQNLRARPHATVLVQDPRVDDTAWVAGSGPAEIVRGHRAQELNRRLRERYLTDHGEQQMGRVLAIHDDATIVVSPAAWLTWDMTALNAELVNQGVPLDGAAKWFREI